MTKDNKQQTPIIERTAQLSDPIAERDTEIVSMANDETQAPKKRTRAPSSTPRRKSRARRKNPPALAVGPEGPDLFDQIEAWWIEARLQARHNVANVFVISGLVALIVAAHYATQEPHGIQPVARAVEASDESHTVAEAPSAPATAISATTEATSTASGEALDAASTAADVASETGSATDSAVASIDPTPTPETNTAPASKITGVIVHAGVSVSAELDPTKIPEELAVVKAPAAQPTVAVKPVRSSRRHRKVISSTLARIRWEDARTPYNAGGELDLDSAAVREKYRQSNRVAVRGPIHKGSTRHAQHNASPTPQTTTATRVAPESSTSTTVDPSQDTPQSLSEFEAQYRRKSKK